MNSAAIPFEELDLKQTPATFRIAARLIRKLKRGRLTVTLPDGRIVRIDGREDGPEADIQILSYAFPRKVISGGIVGVGESYMDGDWDTSDLTTMLELFAVNLDSLQPQLRGNWIARIFNKIFHAMRENTKTGSRKNIYDHYDLGNRFYGQWLDQTMTYSSALFDGTSDLKTAQTRKYAALADQLGLSEGTSVLEIGCGWGGFAEYAAKERGARVTGLTISQEQLEFAQARMQREGLNDKVEIRLQDYRDTTGTFDRIASIEMFEAVGEKYWPVYFDRVRDLLGETGRAALQIITIHEEIFPRYRNSVDFIQRYIFPGGMLPSVTRLREEVSRAGLTLADARMFGKDYARTLGLWCERFNAQWETIEPLGFDFRFRRLWNFYLAYCEAGFRTGRTDVGQFALVKA
jgi:cyclopropane-fatty-acyl-phospholipid synthase